VGAGVIDRKELEAVAKAFNPNADVDMGNERSCETVGRMLRLQR
jgi:hypothetical protein